MIWYGYGMLVYVIVIFISWALDDSEGDSDKVGKILTFMVYLFCVVMWPLCIIHALKKLVRNFRYHYDY